MHRPVSAVIVEDKANGPAVIQRLKVNVPGVIEINPEGGKTARMFAAAPEWQAGDWYVDRNAAWTESFLDQITMFPNARYDDQADMMTQASAWLLRADTASAGTRCASRMVLDAFTVGTVGTRSKRTSRCWMRKRHALGARRSGTNQSMSENCSTTFVVRLPMSFGRQATRLRTVWKLLAMRLRRCSSAMPTFSRKRKSRHVSGRCNSAGRSGENHSPRPAY